MYVGIVIKNDLCLLVWLFVKSCLALVTNTINKVKQENSAINTIAFVL